MRVVLCYPLEDRHLEQLRSAAPDWEFVDAGQERVATELLNADLFCGHAKVPVPWDAIVELGRLRWIQSSASGTDHCLVPSVVASDILVTSASGLFAESVAEQTMTLLLGLLRNMPTFFRAQQAHEFIRRPTADLHGKTIGIAGLGGNGRRIAQLLHAFGCRILATDWFPVRRPPHVERLLPPEALADIAPELDVLILCVPLTPQTREMVDRPLLQRLPRGALLINVARGPVVAERDLIESLQSGHLGGAGLDVVETEPLAPDSPLWDMPRVIITPHVGAQSSRRYDVVTSFFIENLRRFRSVQPLRNLVDKKLGFPVIASECGPS